MLDGLMPMLQTRIFLLKRSSKKFIALAIGLDDKRKRDPELKIQSSVFYYESFPMVNTCTNPAQIFMNKINILKFIYKCRKGV